MAGSRELVAGDEPGHAGADDDDPLAGLVEALEPFHRTGRYPVRDGAESGR